MQSPETGFPDSRRRFQLAAVAMFPKASIKRFNEGADDTPGPNSYNVKVKNLDILAVHTTYLLV